MANKNKIPSMGNPFMLLLMLLLSSILVSGVFTLLAIMFRALSQWFSL